LGLAVEGDEEPYKGEFRDFKATLTHKDYKGVQLNPLIVGVTTRIIGKEDVLSGEFTDGAMAVVNEGNTGFPDYLMNLDSGLRIPIFVPDQVTTTAPYSDGATSMQVKTAKPAATLDYNSVRYQIVMIPEPLGVPTFQQLNEVSVLMMLHQLPSRSRITGKTTVISTLWIKFR
jgi:hypothetical protein